MSFVYDGDGGRVKQTTAEGTTIFLGSSYEIDPTGKATKYVFAGSQRTAAKDSTGALRFYHTNHLGSTHVVTDGAGKPLERIEYLPYGAVHRRDVAQSPEPPAQSRVAHTFTGQRFDASTGLLFYHARYYDPTLGRFLSADPTVQRPGDPQDLNRYAYARNNPLRFVDPTGYGFWDWVKQFGSTVLQIAGIVLAPFTAGASLYLTAAGMAWSGVQAAQAGQLGAWAVGLAVSVAVGFAVPMPTSANLFLQVGAGALRGAAVGALAGGITSVVFGGSFGEGAAFGALGGAAGGALADFVQSQQYTNLAGGYGFRSHEQVLDRLVSRNDFQGAIGFSAKRYGFPAGTYDPNLAPPTAGTTNMITGKVTIGPAAFFDPSTGKYTPSMLQAVGFHEGVHVQQMLMDAPDWKATPQGFDIANRFQLEMGASAKTLSHAFALNLTNEVIRSEISYYNYNASFVGNPPYDPATQR